MRVAVEFLLFAERALVAQFSRFPPIDVLVRQTYQAGVGSVALLTMLIVFAGLNLSVQSYATFERFGGQDFLGMFAGIGGVRELYPVMAAVATAPMVPRHPLCCPAGGGARRAAQVT